MTTTLRVALIDDDPAVLDSTQLVLAEEGIDVEPYASAQAFLQRTETAGAGIDAVVSDVRMPGMTGLELQAELARRGSLLPLILITGHGDVAMAVKALKSGAADFIEKPFAADVLASAIRKAAAAHREHEAQQQTRDDIAKRVAHLSARQQEVMLLVADGYSNKQIAARLGISSRTVETYRLWVMERMGAANLAHLVRIVLSLPQTTIDAITSRRSPGDSSDNG